ncbi:antibiotic biosynthesis monooxygenase family protein [Nocardia arizonensis]|uniref:antibiotic biosynthesis monooxygenase family protein n=1 Tax=Nocardia arizonensis TaxID=1141647 RepID=UPI0006D0558A|nr:antibiotic biosynthesis monooxygenase [Nocardia arizonensis]
MIIEHALLPVATERAAEFEAAFAGARPLIAATPGFRTLTLSRCVESPGTYLLVVEWDDLADHVEGFRGSDRYARWSELLHHFYDPFPAVLHFAPVLCSGPSPAVAASTPDPQ